MSAVNVCKIWNGWHDKVEVSTQKIIYAATRLCPFSKIKFLKEKYLTQFELVVHGLGTAILLQLTIGNPLISPLAAYSISCVGLITTSGVAFRYLKRHFQELGSLYRQHRLASIVFPLILIIAGALSMYSIQSTFHLPQNAFVSLNIWSFYACGTVTIGLHSFLINSAKKEALERKRCIEEQKNARLLLVEKECQDLADQRQELKDKIRIADSFLARHPDLLLACRKRLNEYPEQISYLDGSEDLSGLDPENDLDDRRCILSIEVYTLGHTLNEMRLFIERNPKESALFEKCLREDKQRRKPIQFGDNQNSVSKRTSNSLEEN